MTPWRRARGPGETPASTIKRRDERYLVNTRLTATLNVGQKIEVQGRALDISQHGVGGLFDETWTVGSRIELGICLPVGHSPLKVDAVVRHRTGVKFRYGFEFVEMSAEQRASLQQACKFLAGRKSIPNTDLR
jgi:hypothetical protein